MKRIAAVPGRRDGFTLIELLAVITIILLLAGLILGLAGNAQYKAAQSRAQGEIQALSAAIGNYQIDNGAFPRDPSSPSVTDTMNARDPSTYGDPATKPYTDSSNYLYECLSGSYYYKVNGNNAPVLTFYDQAAMNGGQPKPTAYFPFKENQLKHTGTAGSAQDTPSIVDPFGFSYGYSTAYQADPTKGYNPTFDLWSTAGYSATQGKGTPTNTTTTTLTGLWIKNW